jgi:hypothetical protein
LDGASFCFDWDGVGGKYLVSGKNGILIPQKGEKAKVGESKGRCDSTKRRESKS